MPKQEEIHTANSAPLEDEAERKNREEQERIAKLRAEYAKKQKQQKEEQLRAEYQNKKAEYYATQEQRMSKQEDKMMTAGAIATGIGLAVMATAISTTVAATGGAVATIGVATMVNAGIQKEIRKKSKNQKGD